MSLIRNTDKTRIYIYRFIKMWPQAGKNLTHIFPRNIGSALANSVFMVPWWTFSGYFPLRAYVLKPQLFPGFFSSSSKIPYILTCLAKVKLLTLVSAWMIPQMPRHCDGALSRRIICHLCLAFATTICTFSYCTVEKRWLKALGPMTCLIRTWQFTIPVPN